MRSGGRRTAALFAVMIAFAGTVAGCSDDAGPRMTIGVKFDQPGLGLRGQNGEMSGLDVDVARYVAGKLGVDADDITFVEARTTDREKLLQQHSVDLVVATYSITDARKQVVDFAGPYFVAGQSLLVRRANFDIDGPQSLDNSDWQLCSVADSTPAQKIKSSYAKSVTLQEKRSYPECITALKDQQVDAVTSDDVILAGYAAQQPDQLKVVGAPFSTERYGIGLAKGDDRRAKVTEALRSMVSDGTWQRIVQSNLTGSGYQVPKAPEILDAP